MLHEDLPKTLPPANIIRRSTTKLELKKLSLGSLDEAEDTSEAIDTSMDSASTPDRQPLDFDSSDVGVSWRQVEFVEIDLSRPH